ncbi:MAG: hypothetical protein U0736_24310 [Gemmataceae bacterium]
MHLAILSHGSGWHVADLLRACATLGHRGTVVDFRRLSAGVAADPPPLAGFEAVIVRTMPPGSLEQVASHGPVAAGRGTRRAGAEHAAGAGGVRRQVPDNGPPGRRRPAGTPTVVCQTADAALEAFERWAATSSSNRCSAPRAAAWYA